MKQTSLPHLSFVHLCDSAFLSQDGKLNVIGILKKIVLPQFPNTYPKMMAVINVQMKKPVKIKIQLLKKEAREVVTKVEANIGNQDLEKEHEVVFLAEFLNIKFENPGPYLLETWIDEELKDIQNFVVLQAQINKQS
jgi:hypothetical protein